jgi:hypothetical protein
MILPRFLIPSGLESVRSNSLGVGYLLNRIMVLTPSRVMYQNWLSTLTEIRRDQLVSYIWSALSTFVDPNLQPRLLKQWELGKYAYLTDRLCASHQDHFAYTPFFITVIIKRQTFMSVVGCKDPRCMRFSSQPISITTNWAQETRNLILRIRSL